MIYGTLSLVLTCPKDRKNREFFRPPDGLGRELATFTLIETRRKNP